MELIAELKVQQEELENILAHNKEQNTALLGKAASSIQSWKRDLRQEKAIYHTLNLCRYTRGQPTLIGEGKKTPYTPFSEPRDAPQLSDPIIIFSSLYSRSVVPQRVRRPGHLHSDCTWPSPRHHP